jgi:3-methylfumaryl-CoA hydratase
MDEPAAGGELSRRLESWAPGPVTADDAMPAAPAVALGAVLDVAGPPLAPGDVLPPLWHWLYFLSWPPQRELGDDGHPREGHFLPPLPRRRRMIAGGRLEVNSPLRLGRPARRVSRLKQVAVKHGRTGELVFVTVRSEFSQDSRLCLVEELDVVYRSGEPAIGFPRPTAADPPPVDSVWQLTARPDPALLFRFSALTANAHRIHYDAPYCRDVEGYPGLVVHGPLLAILMLELPRRHAPTRRPSAISYRLRNPVFAGEALRCAADIGRDGRAAMRVATARDDRHAAAELTFA